MLYGVNSRERDKSGFIADKNRYAPWSGVPMSGRMDCRVGAEARVGAAPEDCDAESWGLAVLAPECEVAPGRVVKAGIMLNKRGEERAK